MNASLALSRPLLQWLRQDPAWRSLPAAVRARTAWQAGWGSVNARLSRALDDGRPALRDPLLIVGPWRSGTTVMHELLSAATGCSAPLTWQCMNATSFQLGAAPRNGVALARPMDGLEIRADSPQEDEFALLALGQASAYRAFWMPHRIAELQATLDPAFWLADDGWLRVWESFLRGVLRRAGTAARQPLILKSPNHSFRLPAMLRRFPQARVVWMARSAGDVLASNRKMWRTMFDTHGLTAADDAALEAFLCQALQASARMLAWCGQHLPSAQWCAVPYDDLLTAPAPTVNAVCRHLLAELPIDDAALVQAMARTALGRVERHAPDLAVGSAAADAVRTLDAAQGLAAARFGWARAAPGRT